MEAMGKINLLVVDDEEEFLNLIKKRLELRDFNVIAVNRGEKAVEEARNHPIDIALVDLKMPGMDGEQTLKQLKNEHQWMEIVILTGHGSIKSALDTAKMGAYAYLQKPCDFEVLISTLVEAYKKRVMNKQQIEEARMNHLLSSAMSQSPTEILKKLKELDKLEK
jgi:DNA-binding NtrC family response regulator